MATKPEQALEETKQSFLALCEQYSNLGNLLRMLGSVGVDKRQAQVLAAFNVQYQMMGEQLKLVGGQLDGMGGVSVMHGPVQKGRNPSAN